MSKNIENVTFIFLRIVDVAYIIFNKGNIHEKITYGVNTFIITSNGLQKILATTQLLYLSETMFVYFIFFCTFLT